MLLWRGHVWGAAARGVAGSPTMLTGRLRKQKPEFTSIIKRSARRGKPAASLHVLTTLIFFKYQQKSFFVFIMLSLNGSFKKEIFQTRSLSYMRRLRAGDVWMAKDQSP